jgi:hypothetical protein
MDKPASRMHTGSLFQALLSALGLSACAVAAGFMLVSGLLLTGSGQIMLREQSGVLISLAWTLAFLAAAALPSLIYASRRISGHPAETPGKANGLRSASVAMLIWPLILAAGRALSGSNELSWILLPPLQILAVVLPLWWFVEAARERLPSSSQQRSWGVINFSLFVSTPLVILVEIGLMLAGLAGLVLIISGNPEMVQAFEDFSQRILNSLSNPEALLRIYRPMLAQPAVIFGMLFGLSAVVPLVEELIKPLAVWVLAGRDLTPTEGFTAGALAGAGFALLETLFSLANPAADGWLALTVGRAGTGLLHISTAALMGLALAEAWQSGRYLRLGVTYFGVVVAHGLWNAFSVLNGLSEILAGTSGLVQNLYQIGQAAPYGLGLLALGMLLTLLMNNYRLRNQADLHMEPAQVD